MTDKQIIIDNVDVSGCPHFIEDYQWWNIAGREEHDINRCALSFDGYIDFEEDDFCKENPNCYYKQLKRKEQECEELKDDKIYLQDRVGKLERAILRRNDELDQLKAENEELKEINSQLMKYRKHSATCQECYSDGLEDGKLYNKELHKYKQALKEIKEIAEANAGRFPDGSIFARPEIEQILEKCEVIDEN